MVKYYLGFDSLRLTSSFSYVTRNAITQYLDKENISYTFNIDDDFEEAIFPSASDFFAHYAEVLFKKSKTGIIACNDISDFALKTNGKQKEVSLSLDAINFYRKADHLILFFPDQKKMLEKCNIKTEVTYFPLHPSYQDISNVPECEKDAFRHYYHIPKDKEVIVSYGSFTDKETVYNLESCATICPNKEFIFFGYGDRKAFKKKILETVTPAKNVNYLSYLPSELYRSFLLSADRLLLLGDFLAYPQIFIDCMYHRIPVVTFKLSGCPDLLNENNVSIATNFSTLLSSLDSGKDEAKMENAYQSVIHYLNLKK